MAIGNTTLPSCECLRENENLAETGDHEIKSPRNQIPTKFILDQNMKIYTTKFNMRTVLNHVKVI